MNNQNTSVIPDENKIEEMLGKIQPLPSESFHQKMKQALWVGKQSHPKSISLRIRVAIAMTVVIILTTLAATPQGRAWAQEVVQYFKRINTTTVQFTDEEIKWASEINEQYPLPLVPLYVPTVQPSMAIIPGCETPQKSQSYRCQVALAESQLGYDLKELPSIPDGWELDYFGFSATAATMTYKFDFTYMSYSNLVINQGTGDFPGMAGGGSSMVVPAEKVEAVSVGGYPGEYVKGWFSLAQGDNKWAWSDEDNSQQLAWSDGTRWYLILFFPNLNLPNNIDREQLIQLAESLVDMPVKATEPINPERLLSISDAEKVSGLGLKAPTILPMEVNFSYASYDEARHEARLYYGINEELIVYEWAGEPIDFNQPSNTYEIVQVDGKEAYFGSVENADPHLFLWWYQDGLNYQLYYYQFFGVIDKEKMITIAESMQNIDDFRTKSKKYYTQINIYEQALGIEIKKFPQAPVGWVYSDFWGNPQAQCIDLVYASATGQGTLYIDQCKTGRNSDISNIPRRFTDRVRLRNTKGVYVVGGYVTNNDGKQIWDPTSPIKQLYWQEDGLWMQVTLYGNAAPRYTKDDLIAIAESLK